MARFKDITYLNETLAIGAGCLFDEVYSNKKLHEAHRNIVGGEDLQGIGVAGWFLGGGYSMKTNRFGLGIDNVEAYEVVVPGKEGDTARLEIVKSNDQEQDKKDLFWALKVHILLRPILYLSNLYREEEIISVSSPNLLWQPILKVLYMLVRLDLDRVMLQSFFFLYRMASSSSTKRKPRT